MKRGLDLLISAIGLLLSSPAFAVATVAVKLDTPGPVFFRQKRVGRNGQPFLILKFRSMSVNTTGPAITSASDARITRSGRWLRATKIDELPQLINVIRGDMSVVGPRPEVPAYVALWGDEAYREILSMRPGITDPASIAFRRESELLSGSEDPDRLYREEILPKKVRLYREYVAQHSLIGDLRILLRTVLTTVKD